MHEWTWLNGYKSHLSESQRNEKNYKVFSFYQDEYSNKKSIHFYSFMFFANFSDIFEDTEYEGFTYIALYYPIVIVWIEIVVTEIFEILWKD